MPSSVQSISQRDASKDRRVVGSLLPAGAVPPNAPLEGLKAKFQSWPLTLGSGVTAVAITRAGLGLGGWGYHTWAGLEHQGEGKRAQLLLLSLGFSLGCPQIAQAEACGACCALFLLKEGGFLGCSADTGNNRKSVGNCNIFHFSQYCPDDVFLVLIRLFKAQFL